MNKLSLLIDSTKKDKCQFSARFGVLKTKNEILEGERQMLVPLFGQSSRTEWTGNVFAWKKRIKCHINGVNSLTKKCLVVLETWSTFCQQYCLAVIKNAWAGERNAARNFLSLWITDVQSYELDSSLRHVISFYFHFFVLHFTFRRCLICSQY